MTLRTTSLGWTTPEAMPSRKRPIARSISIAILVVALEIVLIILDRLERRRALARGEIGIESVEAEEMVDRADRGQRQHLGRERAQAQLPLPLEHVVGELVGRRERGAVDRRERGQILLAGGALGVEISVA